MKPGVSVRGRSFRRWVDRIRAAAATHLLRTTRLTTERIAEEVHPRFATPARGLPLSCSGCSCSCASRLLPVDLAPHSLALVVYDQPRPAQTAQGLMRL